MALSKKQDNSNNKKEAGKKGAGKKVVAQKDIDLSDKKDVKKDVKKDIDKEKKELVKKEPVKKELPVKKEKVNYVEQVQKFLRGVQSELKKVHWPTRREVIIYTSVVLVAVVAVGVLIWVFDVALSSVLQLIIKK